MFLVAKFIQNSDNALQAKNMTVNKSNGGFQIISRDPIWVFYCLYLGLCLLHVFSKSLSFGKFSRCDGKLKTAH